MSFLFMLNLNYFFSLLKFKRNFFWINLLIFRFSNRRIYNFMIYFHKDLFRFYSSHKFDISSCCFDIGLSKMKIFSFIFKKKTRLKNTNSK